MALFEILFHEDVINAVTIHEESAALVRFLLSLKDFETELLLVEVDPWLDGVECVNEAAFVTLLASVFEAVGNQLAGNA